METAFHLMITQVLHPLFVRGHGEANPVNMYLS